MQIDFNEYFIYDETSPSCLRWKIDRMCGEFKNVVVVSKGDAAGCPLNTGYYKIGLHNKTYVAHRIIFAMMNDAFDYFDYSLEIDHIDRNRGNNQFDNLRAITKTKNNRNIKQKKTNKSGVTGVHRDSVRGTWIATWQEDDVGCRKRFKTFEEACEFRKTTTIERLNTLGYGYTETHGM